jgi:glycosyltransferase involved in cell wall biosynthesis
LTGAARPRLLFVAHGGAGGIARHMEDLAALAAPRADVWLLQPHGETHLSLRDFSPGAPWRAWPHRTHWPRVVEWLREAGIDRVHFHHVHGLPREALALPHELGCPCDVTLHDYFPVCSRYHMVDASDRFCGGAPDCRRCDEARTDMWNLGVDAWRAAFAPWLASAARLIVPSRDAAERIREHVPDARPEVWPHPESARGVRATTRVLLLGAVSPEKGIDTLEACLADATARDLPLQFRLVGLTSRALPQSSADRFSLTGEYAEGDLDRLLERERGDVVLFLARCPETFSYTLSAALRSGLPIVAPDLGAFRTRLEGIAHARMLPWDAAAREINDALIASAPRAAARMNPEGASDPAEYAQRYLAAIEPGRAQPQPALPADWVERPAEGPSGWTLPALFDDGVLCGRASSRELLRAGCVEAEATMARLDASLHELADATTEALAEARRERELAEESRQHSITLAFDLEQEKRSRAAAEAQLAEIRASTSWRLTAPLRALRRLMRRPA